MIAVISLRAVLRRVVSTVSDLLEFARIISLLLALAALEVTAADQAQPLLKKVGEYHLLRGRQGAAAVALGNYVYIIGGKGHGTLRNIERFDTRTHTIASIYDQLLPRRYHSAVEHNGHIYIFGGLRQTVQGEQYCDSVEIFDCATGAVALGKPLPFPRAHMGAAKVGEKVYLIGGTTPIEATFLVREESAPRGVQYVEQKANGAIRTNRTDIFNLATGQWSGGPTVGTARECAAVTVGNFILAAGGFTGDRAVATVESLDPQAGEWRVLPGLSRGISANSAVFMQRFLFLFGDYDKPASLLAYDLSTRGSQEISTNFKGVRHSSAIAVHDLIYVIGGNTLEPGGESDLIQVFALASSTSSTSAN
jgi:hypothetical protein